MRHLIVPSYKNKQAYKLYYCHICQQHPHRGVFYVERYAKHGVQRHCQSGEGIEQEFTNFVSGVTRKAV